MTKLEAIMQIQEAQELIREARELVLEAIKGTDQKSHFESYAQYGFKQLLGEGNPMDDSLQTIIDEL